MFRGSDHWKNTQANEPSDAVQTASDAEIMWLRDLLPDLVPHARIATYSYESDWRKAGVKTSLRQCGEQLLNVLLQNRSTDDVGGNVLDVLQSYLLNIAIGAPSTACVHWT